jgi:YHS domain-containing protein
MKRATFNLFILCASLCGIAPLPANTHRVNDLIDPVSEYETQLFLTPGGKYTKEDIQANGNMTPAQKFKEFSPAHDPRPKAGEVLCPITLTKAHPECTWVIAGKTYQFCCPPCIDEFLQAAKEHPEKLQGPEAYIKR